ncbi:hypothetical protein KEM48_011213 [Puccinia striiformis f. sp. tritici PST-130]|nr:hypothetical protein KEM48_011213 [Puccinia striiformis f. sp. tritici PST-130]
MPKKDNDLTPAMLFKHREQSKRFKSSTIEAIQIENDSSDSNLEQSKQFKSRTIEAIQSRTITAIQIKNDCSNSNRGRLKRFESRRILLLVLIERSQLLLCIDSTVVVSIGLFRVKWDLVKLYPNIIFDKNNNPNCSPTPEEVASAYKNDLSDYAFVMFLPTYSATDHKFGIKFDHQHGIVEMIWKANQYRHCTLPSSSSLIFTWLGFSLQINYSLARTCYKEQKDI